MRSIADERSSIPVGRVPWVAGAQENPDVSGSRIVWGDYRTPGNHEDIYMYDAATGLETLISDAPEQQRFPRISSRLIAWEDNRNFYTAGSTDIYAFDLSTEMEIVVSNDTADEHIVGVDGTKVAFTRQYDTLVNELGGTTEVYNLYVYDVATGVTTPITNFTPNGYGIHQSVSANAQRDGDFGDNFLIWSEQTFEWITTGSGKQIWSSESESTRKIDYSEETTPVTVVSSPSNPMAASDGRFVWSQYVSGKYQVHIWNHGSESIVTSEDTDHAEYYIAIGSHYVVYDIDSANGAFYTDLNSGAEHLVTDQLGGTYDSVRMDGNGVVWQDDEDGNTHIYFAFIEHPDVAMASADMSATNTSPVEGETFDVSVDVKNLTEFNQPADISVRLFDGDPDTGGTEIAPAQVIIGGLAGSAQSPANFIGISLQGEGPHTLYARMSIVGYDNPDNNTATITVDVQDSDIQGPMFTGPVIVEEYLGDGDGLIGDDEQVRLSWALTDVSGIASVDLLVDGSPVPVTDEGGGNYSALLGPLGPGQHGYEITATDADESPETSVNTGSFDVVNSEVLAVQYGGSTVAQGEVVDLGIYLFNVTANIIPIIIRNNGEQDLTLSGLDVQWTVGAGTHTEVIIPVLESTNFTYFTITPDTGTLGIFRAEVTILNSDVDLSPFVFAVNGQVALPISGDLNTDWFVGIEDLNIVLGAWNQNVVAGDLGAGDPSGDGFVGIEDLNLVLGNWNATLLSPLIEGDLNADGFVGVDDLNIVLGNWNQNVTLGDLLAGDPSGDGFVGVDDLNLVLGNWNAGTPPAALEQTTAVEPASTSFVVEESPEDTRALATMETEAPAVQSDEEPTVRSGSRHRSAASDSVSGPAHPTRQTRSGLGLDTRNAIAAWQHRDGRMAEGPSDRTGYIPWLLGAEDDVAPLGLWE